jgi:hypothetical protein
MINPGKTLRLLFLLMMIGLLGCSANSVEIYSDDVADVPVCQARFVESSFEPESCSVDNLSPEGTYRFFSVCDLSNDGKDEVDVDVYMEDVMLGKMYHIQSDCFLDYRPVAQNQWIYNKQIGFIIWSTPHYGQYFVVNADTKKMEVNYPVSDDSDAPEIPIK